MAKRIRYEDSKPAGRPRKPKPERTRKNNTGQAVDYVKSPDGKIRRNRLNGGIRKGSGAKKWVPTQYMKFQVETMRGFGTTIEVIHRCVCPDVDLSVFVTAFAREFDVGEDHMKARLQASIWEQAVGRPAEYDPKTGRRLRAEQKPVPNVTIFTAKARLGWRDRDEPGGAHGDDPAITEIVIDGGLPPMIDVSPITKPADTTTVDAAADATKPPLRLVGTDKK